MPVAKKGPTLRNPLSGRQLPEQTLICGEGHVRQIVADVHKQLGRRVFGEGDVDAGILV
jgi:hypothetical protein